MEEKFNDGTAAIQHFITDAIHTTAFLVFQCFDDTCNFEFSSGFNEHGFVTIKDPRNIVGSWVTLDDNFHPLLTDHTFIF